MAHDLSRLRVAIADPSSFGQNMLSDLLMDEGIKDIAKYGTGRELVVALMTDEFHLVLVDDELPQFSAVELAMLAKGTKAVPRFIALQSLLARDDVAFLRGRGVDGVLLKPVAPKRFSALFRSLFKQTGAVHLAARAA